MTNDFALNPSGILVPVGRPKPLKLGMWVPCPAIEQLFPEFGSDFAKKVGALILKPLRERIGILQMSGSLANFLSKSLMDLVFGKTAYTGPSTNIYFGLWTAALDDTLAGNTSSEAAYTSYARLALTDNTTIFAAGSGTTTYTKTFPSDATKSFATSTGSTATVTYLGMLDGNAGTSADKGLAWCSVTSTTINNGDTPQLAQNAVSVVND